MNKLSISYGIDDKPPFLALIIFSLQWLALMGVATIILGKVVAALHYPDSVEQQILYMQKLFFLSATGLLVQIFSGHRLPLILGPAVILLVGILSAAGKPINVVYSNIMLAASILSLLCIFNLFPYLARLFTLRVVASILILIALTISPTILKLLLSAGSPDKIPLNLLFAFILLLSMLIADRLLKGVWRSSMLVWALIFGSLAAFLFLPLPESESLPDPVFFSNIFKDFTLDFAFDPGLLISFFICFIALAINDIGSIESIGKLLNPPNMDRRLKRGMLTTALINVLAGFFGIIGLVNFSLTAGVIASNGNASRISFLPAALIVLMLAFMPFAVAFIWNIPAVLIGTLLLYIMSLQLAAGLVLAFSAKEFDFQDAMIIAIPLMISILVSYLPKEAVNALPSVFIPVFGNAFVMGSLSVLLLEHLILRKPKPKV